MVQHKPFPGQATRSPTTLGKATFRLPPIQESVGYGGFGGVKMSKNSQTLIFRSVPPRPFSYTFSDEINNSYGSRRSKSRSKTAPVSINSPRDYVQRFKSRPVTKPNVVEFNGGSVLMEMNAGARCADGFFPPVKLRLMPYQSKGRTTIEPSHLHLEPISRPETGIRSDTTLPHSPNSTQLVQHSKTPGSLHRHIVTMKSPELAEAPKEKSPESCVRFPDFPDDDKCSDPEYSIVYPNILSDKNHKCDDLSSLPRPKRIHAKRELPWVFRFKVKKNMNSLSKIMASKTPNSQTVPESQT
ncbi:uncharacterized protein LOC121380051 [Gigantopelta aegis]|uniref:uncharacterized protein LOC121380051 n=1 Tax=Gigantopelta aegis TaxID=1735272 RepID=UPI001B88DA6A|nr:uncharacterized protein LOC121380051 [Gigantopelta aegis]